MFLAKLISTKPLDQGRDFTFTVYLADHTVAVYEPTVRNSGIIAGMFQKRSKLVNPETGKPYHASEFHVGATIVCKGQPFEMVDADNHSLEEMESEPGVWPMHDPSQVLEAIKQKFVDTGRGMHEV